MWSPLDYPCNNSPKGPNCDPYCLYNIVKGPEERTELSKTVSQTCWRNYWNDTTATQRSHKRCRIWRGIPWCLFAPFWQESMWVHEESWWILTTLDYKNSWLPCWIFLLNCNLPLFCINHLHCNFDVVEYIDVAWKSNAHSYAHRRLKLTETEWLVTVEFIIILLIRIVTGHKNHDSTFLLFSPVETIINDSKYTYGAGNVGLTDKFALFSNCILYYYCHLQQTLTKQSEAIGIIFTERRRSCAHFISPTQACKPKRWQQKKF